MTLYMVLHQLLSSIITSANNPPRRRTQREHAEECDHMKAAGYVYKTFEDYSKTENVIQSFRLSWENTSERNTY